MKIAIIGIVGVPASYGGFETLVDNLLDGPFEGSVVYCSGLSVKKRISVYKGANLVYWPISANGSMSVVYDVISIFHAFITGHRNFLLLGTSGAVILPVLRFFSAQVNVVTNIDGIEWKRAKWNGLARWFLRVSEKLCVRYSSTVVADNDAIACYVRESYQRSCVTIPYGGDHALMPIDHNPRARTLVVDSKFSFSVCRIEPENNTHLILSAFSTLDVDLVFIGNWQSSDYGKKLVKEYSKYPNIYLMDPVYDVSELAAYRNECYFYVHGHSAGGTNPSLVEIMHFDKPIIAFDCAYNRATMENHGSFFHSADSLSKLIKNTKVLPGAVELGTVARERYTWDIVTNRYVELFK